MNDVIFVNTNVALSKPGRKAPKMSIEQFINILADVYKKATGSALTEQKDDRIVCELIGEAYFESESNLFATLENDIKVIGLWGAENFNCISIAMTKSGVPYAIMMAGGDWELPALYMVYWDGQRLRGYVPTYGNCFNRKTKELFGNDEEMDAEFLAKELKMRIDEFENFWNTFNLTYDIDKCKEDFEHRIVAI